MSSTEKLDKSNIEDILPLTPMQESMLFQYLKSPQSEAYFEQLCLTLHGQIQSEVFRQAWEFVAETNEILRTVFRWDKLEQPIQVVLKKKDIPIRECDFTSFDHPQIQEMIAQVRDQDREEKIDLRTAPFRITLCKSEDEVFEMIISNHHILYDGWSNGILLDEFIEAYNRFFEGAIPNRPQKNQFKDFIKWQREQDKEGQQQYWGKYLQGFDTRTPLPLARKRQSDSFQSDEFSCFLPDELMQPN